MTKSPNISVILPVFNAAGFLHQAVDSVLSQSYTDFELIAVDDGSTDASLSILKEYASIDQRVVIVSRENRGLVATLNDGIKLARGNLIARMDADDIAYPERFSEQVAFLGRHPEIDIVGCDFDLIDIQGKIIGRKSVPKTQDDFFFCLLSTVPFAHPSVMGRSDFFRSLTYREEPLAALVEDYDLWLRGYRPGRYGNLNKVLLAYRYFSDSFSFSKLYQMHRATRELGKCFFEQHEQRFWEALSDENNGVFKCRACAQVFDSCSAVRWRLFVFMIKQPFLFFRVFFNLLLIWRKGIKSFWLQKKNNFFNN